MDLNKISVTILVKNAEKTIGECLNSLVEFNEIVILDNGSTDATLEIVTKYQERNVNIKIYQHDFIGFGPLKNLAISFASNDWIFSIDSDEILDKEALAAIKAGHFSDDEVIAISRKNLYKGEWIKACGWSPDYVLRLFNRNKVRFNDNQVHECLVVNKNNIKKIDGYIVHYAFDSIDSLLDKLQRYSGLWAKQNLHKKVSVCSAIIHGTWNFLRNYLFKKGILFGYKGFIISVCNGLGAFFKYMKLYELKYSKPKSVSLIVTTYNQKERLSLVLDSIKNLNVLPNEVIIADDGSKRDTKDLILKYQQEFPCPLIHVWQEDLGFRAAKIRNEGIKVATGEYIVFIDGDMVLNEYFIKDHLDYAVRGQFLQGNRILLDKHETENLLKDRNCNSYKKTFAHKSYKARRCSLLSNIIYKFSYHDKKFFKKNDLIKGSKSCNISFFKNDAISSGLFDERYVGWGLEDSDFVARFLINGGIFRRLKFKGLAYHLYHEENSRDRAQTNKELYLTMINQFRNQK